MPKSVMDVSKVRTNHRTYKKDYTALNIMEMRECSKGKAYKIINTLNAELNEQGIMTDPGRVNKDYYHERCDIPRKTV